MRRRFTDGHQGEHPGSKRKQQGRAVSHLGRGRIKFDHVEEFPLQKCQLALQYFDGRRSQFGGLPAEEICLAREISLEKLGFDLPFVGATYGTVLPP